jgi:hypothetical protein
MEFYTFDTSTLESKICKVKVTPILVKDNNSFSPQHSQQHLKQLKRFVTNNATLQCYDETMITFTVDDLPEAFNRLPNDVLR